MLDSGSGQVQFSLRVTTRGAALFFAAALLALSAFECGSEEYSLAAYYPVPYGSFTRLQVTKQFVIVTGSNTGPRLSLMWPRNTSVPIDSAADVGTRYDQGFIFLNESTTYPLRLIAMNGTSGNATINMLLTNASSLDSRILLYSDTSNYQYTRMKNFCYWYTAATPSAGCLADTTAGTANQWNVVSVTRTAGACDGYNISHTNTTGGNYCTQCCKLGL